MSAAAEKASRTGVRKQPLDLMTRRSLVTLIGAAVVVYAVPASYLEWLKEEERHKENGDSK